MIIFYKPKEDKIIKYYIPNPQYELKATIYNNHPSQCWGDGQITASGKRLYGKNVDNLKYVALSRDMIKPTRYHKQRDGYNPNAPFEFGDTIVVKFPEGEELWTVQDAMAKRHKKRIDFLAKKSYFKVKSNSMITVEKFEE